MPKALHNPCTALLLCALALFLPGLAWAEEPAGPASPRAEQELRARAEAYYQSSVRLYGQGRYREALGDLDAALLLQPEPVLLCNRAAMLMQLGAPGQALQSLEGCREGLLGGTSPPEEMARLEAQIAAMRAGLEVVGRHSREVAAAVAARPAQEVPDGALARVPASAPAPEWRRTGGVSLGLGIALMGSALIVDQASAGLRADFVRESQGGPGTTAARYEELREALWGRQVVFGALGVAGGLLTATGAGLLAWQAVFSGDAAPSAALHLGVGTVGVSVKFLGP